MAAGERHTEHRGERPEALAWSTANCQVERALAVVGQRASMVVLREVFNGVRRFEDVQRHAGLSRQVLTDRLALLVDHGVLRRAPYREEGQRERAEYHLTAKGLELYPVLVALAQWGADHYADDGGAAVEFVHRGCGERAAPAVRCAGGHLVDDPRDLAPRPGPGARRL